MKTSHVAWLAALVVLVALGLALVHLLRQRAKERASELLALRLTPEAKATRQINFSTSYA